MHFKVQKKMIEEKASFIGTQRKLDPRGCLIRPLRWHRIYNEIHFGNGGQKIWRL